MHFVLKGVASSFAQVLSAVTTLFFLVLILDALADKQRQCMAEVVTPKAVLKSASCVCLVKLCAISIPDI